MHANSSQWMRRAVQSAAGKATTRNSRTTDKCKFDKNIPQKMGLVNKKPSTHTILQKMARGIASWQQK